MNSRITPENITELRGNEIFVFGSNEAGIHGAGAAKLAYKKWGAKLDCGFGTTSYRTFAIPTKNWQIQTLELDIIQNYVNRFIAYAKLNPLCIFLVTEIGCGLAGYTPEEIAPLFREAVNLENVYLPQRFWDVLNKSN